MTNEENLIIDLVGGDRDEGDYRDISVIEIYKISVQEATFKENVYSFSFEVMGGYTNLQ